MLVLGGRGVEGVAVRDLVGVQGLGFRVQISGCRIQGEGCGPKTMEPRLPWPSGSFREIKRSSSNTFTASASLWSERQTWFRVRGVGVSGLVFDVGG